MHYKSLHFTLLFVSTSSLYHEKISKLILLSHFICMEPILMLMLLTDVDVPCLQWTCHWASLKDASDSVGPMDAVTCNDMQCRVAKASGVTTLVSVKRRSKVTNLLNFFRRMNQLNFTLLFVIISCYLQSNLICMEQLM